VSLPLTTRATVDDLLGRIASGDAEKTAELFAERVDFACAGTEEAPWIRPRQSREDMADFFRSMNESFVPEDRSASLSAFLVDEEDAVVVGRISQRLKSNGRAFTSPFALHLTVTDGLITRYHVYEDSLAVAEAVST
jgi:ketosteroid isomerase-like protein